MLKVRSRYLLGVTEGKPVRMVSLWDRTHDIPNTTPTNYHWFLLPPYACILIRSVVLSNILNTKLCIGAGL